MNLESLVETLNTQTSIEVYIFSMLLSAILGICVWYSYRLYGGGFTYDNSFSFTLVFIAVIITSIIITLGTNIALSLGLIGSLSIIRFRNAVKNSAELSYLFWAIAIGLANGSQNYSVAIIVTIFLFILSRILSILGIFKGATNKYVLIGIVSDPERLENLLTELGSLNLDPCVHSLSKNANTVEVVIELNNIRGETRLSQITSKLNKLRELTSFSISSPNNVVTL